MVYSGEDMFDSMFFKWHNEIKPHLSLNIEALETPIQAFHRKLPLEKAEAIQTIQDAK